MSVKELADSAAALEAMAQEAGTAYYANAVKYRISKFPKLGIRKSRNWSRFMQIARICLTNNIDVTHFVDEAFVHTFSRHAIVTAQDICSYDPKNLLRGEDSMTRTASPQDLWNLLSCKLLDMVFALDGIKDKTDLLDNPLYGFPAWFRVFSPDHPVQGIIVHWGDLAFEEMSEDPKLNEFLRTKRPATYKLLKSVIDNI